MRRWISVAAIIIACFLLQCTVFNALSIASTTPNLLIIVATSFGFMRGKKEGLIIGLCCGVLMDLFYGNYLGVYALLYMYVGFINGFFKKSFYPEDIKLPVFLMALGDLTSNLVIYLGMFWLRGRFQFGYYLIHTIMPELVYTMIVAIVLYFILLKINQHLEAIEKRSAIKFG